MHMLDYRELHHFCVGNIRRIDVDGRDGVFLACPEIALVVINE